MGNTLQGNSVLLFGGQKDIAPHPVVQLGIDASGHPQPLSVDATGRPATALNQSSAAPSSFAVQTATQTVFTLAAGERGFIQNLDDAELHVKLGASASTSSFNFLLKANSAADKADGGYVKIENWIGPVSVAPSTGTARYIAWKI